ncbi:MAG TPA: helix-turn-helix transcriptional regulator [Candidatus Limnocylindrales bacterium]|jgi:transcriptional regulator with XRE-family HTH domain
MVSVDDQRALDELGAWLRRRRQDRAWSQRQLARRSSIDQPTISRLERGLRPRLRASAIARILIALGVVAPARGNPTPVDPRR